MRTPSHLDAELRRMLVKARKEAGLTQAQVAERLGLERSNIAKIESGARDLYFLDFVVLCNALKIDPGKFVARLLRLLQSPAR